MSEFDKEAERERLREKYEQDREKRAATQRMSELLLKGATMTNSHCDACGDPIFRYEGQEFCPTCQAAGEAEAAAPDGETPEATPDAESAESSPDTRSTDAPNGEADATAEAPTDADRPPAPEATRPRRTPPSVGSDDAASADGRVRDLVETDSRPTRAERTPDRSRDDASNASVSEARASLSRTLVRYARAAEETDDPRRARELLAAAREAAETLAALDGSGRF